jgi:hypothetical protein
MFPENESLHPYLDNLSPESNALSPKDIED